MNIELESTENSQVFDVKINGEHLMGEITNKVKDGDFMYKTDDIQEYFKAEHLRAIADKLDELNGL